MNYRTYAFALVVAANVCYAETVISVDLQKLNYEEPELEVQPVALSFSISQSITESIRFVGLYGVGIYDDNADSLPVKADFSVNYISGAYLKATFLKDNHFQPYGYFGYTQIKLTGESGASAFSQTEHDFGYGIGFDYTLNSALSFHMDYSKIVDSETTELSSANLGFSLAL